MSALANGLTSGALHTVPHAPTLGGVTAILVVRDESFRQHLHQRLLEADCEDVRMAQPPAELPPLLFESNDTVVILGGRWPDMQPLLRTAVRSKAPAILVLQPLAATPHKQGGQRSALLLGANAALDEDAHEALEIGASAVLYANISQSGLKAAIAASHAGLIVLDNALKVHRESMSSHDTPAGRAHHTARQLSPRERKILSLVASGVSNKGIARNLGVSINTIKFHLAAAFEKLDAATRAEAVAEGIRRGELSV